VPSKVADVQYIAANRCPRLQSAFRRRNQIS
jgi:hypothetical protein